MKNRYKLLMLTMMVTSLVGCTQKQVNIDKPNGEIGSSLTGEESENLVIEKLCRIYNFDSKDLKMVYSNKKLSFLAKDFDFMLMSTLKYNSANYMLQIPEDVELIETELDKDKSLLKLKFNKDFIKDMPLGTATESGLIDSIVKTFGYNHGVDYVAIYFNDELYKGLKGELENDGFKVIIEGEEEVKTSNEVGIKIFLYDAVSDGFKHIDKLVEIDDTSLLPSAINEHLKIVSKDNEYFNFGNDLNVKTVTLDKEKGLVTIDLDSSIYNSLTKVGSGSEAGMLEGLAYTYGYNLDVDKVEILVDGKPYSGSHILYGEGEYITVNILSIN